ncbi:MAG: Maf family protein [Phycisphaeraceae bacterium]
MSAVPHRSAPDHDAARLVLGSASPRRADLLRQAGFAFVTQTSSFDESAEDLAGLAVAEQVQRLAEGKAKALAEQVSHGLILTADTLVSVADQPVGKPTDAADARCMLERLIGQSHQVFTGVCVIDAAESREPIAFVDAATVTIAPLSTEALETYIASQAWRGKAGGYNLAELETRWRFTVEGDPSTVVGLPMQRLTPMLRQRLSGRQARR